MKQNNIQLFREQTNIIANVLDILSQNIYNEVIENEIDFFVFGQKQSYSNRREFR